MLCLFIRKITLRSSDMATTLNQLSQWKLAKLKPENMFDKGCGWVENDASARHSNISSALCDPDFRLTDPPKWSFHAHALRTTCANWHQCCYARFQNRKYRVHEFGNRRTKGRMDPRTYTDGRTKGQSKHIIPPPASLAWRRMRKTWHNFIKISSNVA